MRYYVIGIVLLRSLGLIVAAAAIAGAIAALRSRGS
jgi:hypothetical protein